MIVAHAARTPAGLAGAQRRAHYVRAGAVGLVVVHAERVAHLVSADVHGGEVDALSDRARVPVVAHALRNYAIMCGVNCSDLLSVRRTSSVHVVLRLSSI